MTPIQLSFMAFRSAVDREVYEPGLREWQQIGAALRRLWRIVVMVPDRGTDARPDDVPAEYFRFPPF